MRGHLKIEFIVQYHLSYPSDMIMGVIFWLWVRVCEVVLFMSFLSLCTHQKPVHHIYVKTWNLLSSLHCPPSIGPYLLVVTEKQKVGELEGHIVWEVKGSDVIPFTKTNIHLNELQVREVAWGFPPQWSMSVGSVHQHSHFSHHLRY